MESSTIPPSERGTLEALPLVNLLLLFSNTYCTHSHWVGIEVSLRIVPSISSCFLEHFIQHSFMESGIEGFVQYFSTVVRPTAHFEALGASHSTSAEKLCTLLTQSLFSASVTHSQTISSRSCACHWESLLQSSVLTDKHARCAWHSEACGDSQFRLCIY
jgi:hypothetical protein